jgi:hypothetical protein
MARASRGVPREGAERMAAAVARYGGERQAADALGLSRGTVNGVLQGRVGLGERSRAALDRLPDQGLLGRVGAMLGVGRDRSQQVAAARELARAERAERGATIRATAEHSRRMRGLGLDVLGQPLVPREDGRERSWRELQRRAEAGQVNFADARYASRRTALQDAIERRTGRRPAL